MRDNKVNTMRHGPIFSPELMGRIDVIGIGAVGSKVAMSVAKLGVRRLHIWDMDVVESHNIANQYFSIADVGRPKVDAMADHIMFMTGLRVTKHNRAADEKIRPGQVVFLCMDGMDIRNQLMNRAHRWLNTELIVETRMGVDLIYCYTVCMANPEELDEWKKRSYPDDEVAPEEVGVCRTRMSMGPTGTIAAELAVWQMIKWHNIYVLPSEKQVFKDRDNSLSNEIMVSFRPDAMFASKFTKATTQSG